MAYGVYFSVSIHGHVYPSLPLARALAGRGHRIVYYAGRAHEEVVRRAGAEYRAYPDTVDASALGNRARTGDYLAYTMVRAVHSMLGRPLQELRDDPPEFVMHDCVAPWGKLLAGLLGVPEIAFAPFFVHNAETEGWMKRVPPPPPPPAGAMGRAGRSFTMRTMALTAKVNAMLKEAGVKAVPMREFARCYGGLNVVSTSREFQPCGDTFGPEFEFVGPLIELARAEPPAGGAAPARERLAYCCLGTTNNSREPALLRTCLEALGAFEGRAVVSLGGAVEPDAVGSVPSNVELERFIPEADEFALIGRADVVINHAGFGTTHKCLLQGTPLVLVPLNFEHARNAWRVQEVGAGLRFDKQGLTAGALAEALARVCAETSFAESARRISETLARAGGAARAAEAVERFLGVSPRPPAANEASGEVVA